MKSQSKIIIIGLSIILCIISSINYLKAQCPDTIGVNFSVVLSNPYPNPSNSVAVSSNDCSGLLESPNIDVIPYSGFIVSTSGFTITASDGVNYQIGDMIPGGVTIEFTYQVNTIDFATGIGNSEDICIEVLFNDVTHPYVIFAPQDTIINCNEDSSPTSLGQFAAGDNCTNPPAIIMTESSSFNGSVSVITRMWEATDDAGNMLTHVQSILITCPFRINELDTNQEGIDDSEFVEIYDGGLGNTPLDNLVLVFYNGNTDASYYAIDLDGQTTNANGIFVIQNGNLGTPISNWIQNGGDAVALYLGDDIDFPNGTMVTSTNAELIDALVYTANGGTAAGLLAGLNQSTLYDENTNGNSETESIQRIPDGAATIQIDIPSPGQLNFVGCNIATPDIILTNQTDIDNFQATYGTCNFILGDLRIEDNLDGLMDISNLNGLANIGHISGTLYIRNNEILSNVNGLSNLSTIGDSLSIWNNLNLVDIDGLSNVDFIGGMINIWNNESLQNVDGLLGITRAYDKMDLTNNASLLNIDGLSNLSDIDSSLYIWQNNAIADIDGLLGLSNITGSLCVAFNSSLQNLDGLANVTQIDGYFGIFENNLLSNLSGLSNLNQVKKQLSITNNANLITLNGLNNLNYVGGLAIFQNHALINLDGFASLNKAGNEGIFQICCNDNLENIDGFSQIDTIQGNVSILSSNSLTNLNGFSNLLFVGGNLEIIQNSDLNECCGLNNLFSNGTIGGTINMSSNLGNCNNNGGNLADCMTTITITQQPQDTTICENTPALFYIEATSNGVIPLTYQWQINTNDGNGFTDITGETNDTLILQNVLEQFSEYDYRVVLTTDTITATSFIASLHVDDLIVFNPVFDDVTICEGGGLSLPTFNALVNINNSSFSASELIWQVNDGNGFIDIPNSNASILGSNVNNIGLDADGNQYRMKYTNACGEQFSPIITISVIDGITNNNLTINFPNDYNNCPGEFPGTIDGSTPTGGDGNYTYIWESSTNGSNFTPISGETGEDYLLPNLNQTTFYKRLVSSGECMNDVSETEAVTVHPAPYANLLITTASGSTSTNAADICQGESVNISASVNANSTILWSTGETTTTINPSPTQNTNYTITVTTQEGCTTTETASISVNENPTLTLDAAINISCFGLTDGEIEVSASGGSTPYSLLLNNGTPSTGIFDDLSAGTYAITLTDANNCTSEVSNIVIEEPVQRTFIDFSGNPNYTDNVVHPLQGASSQLFVFEAKITDTDGIMPLSAFPMVRMDYAGDGNFSEQEDRVFVMNEKDPSDTDITDGKAYIYQFFGLQTGLDWQSQIFSKDVMGCETTFGNFNEPMVLNQPDVGISVGDITFSNDNPDVGETIDVGCTIHNNADLSAQNFDVILKNQFDNTIYEIKTISVIAAHSTATALWTVTMPNEASFNPFECIVDINNDINEPNENDNSATRPVNCGNFILSASIDASGSANPGTIQEGSIGQIVGSASYQNLASPTISTIVAGATVTINIIGEETVVGYTNSSGNFSIPLPSNLAVGTYQFEATVTDFTLSDNFSGSFTIVPTFNNSLPDLKPELFLNKTVAPTGASVVEGFVIVKNNGGVAAPASVLSITGPVDANGVAVDYSVPSISAGSSATINLSTITFNSPGGGFVCATVDPENAISESNESNNESCRNMFVVYGNNPGVGGGGGGGCFFCPNSGNLNNITDCIEFNFPFSVTNPSGLPISNLETQFQVYQSGNLIYSAMQNVNVQANQTTQVYFPYLFPSGGDYEVSLTTDPNDLIMEGNETDNTYTQPLFVFFCETDPGVNCNNISVVPDGNGNALVNVPVTNFGNGDTDDAITVLVENGSTNNMVNTSSEIPAGSIEMVEVSIPLPMIGNSIDVTLMDPTGDDSNTNNNFCIIDNVCTELTLEGFGNIDNFWEEKVFVDIPINFALLAKNTGLFAGEDIEVNFKVSGPGISGEADLGNIEINSISGGNSSMAALGLPFSFSEIGNYTVKMEIDPNNEIIECNETNNILEKVVCVTVQPDLFVKSEDINPTALNPDPNELIDVSFTFSNIGSSNYDDNFEVQLQIDDNAVLANIAATGLGTNESTTVSFSNVQIPSNPGGHILKAVVDVGNMVSEADEANNEATRAIIVGTSTNLTVSNFSTDNNTPVIGETVIAAATVENVGSLDCDATIKFSFIDENGNETLIGSSPVVLLAGENMDFILNWEVITNNAILKAEVINPTCLEWDNFDNEATLEFNSFSVALMSTNETCPGEANGAVSTFIMGGNSPFSYTWSTGETTEQIANLTAGNYSVTIADADGRIRVSNQVLSGAIAPLNGLVINHNDVSCHGDSTGVFEVGVSGGMMPYIYDIGEGSQSTAVFDTLIAGGYSVTITDANGCMVVIDTLISEPSNLTTVAQNAISVSCFGFNDGSIEFTASGGVSPYQFNIGNGNANSGLFDNLTGGQYVVTITDANACTASMNGFVFEPDTLSADFISVENINCFGDATGNLFFEAEGGIGPYSFDIGNGGINNGSFNNLVAGNYTLTITDNNGCTADYTETLTEESEIIPSVLSQINPSCFAEADGTISLDASGGVPPYFYGFNGSLTLSNTFDNLSAGTHVFIIEDQNGCQRNISVALTEPQQIIVNSTTQTNVTINGGNDGSIEVGVVNGQSPFLFDIGNGQQSTGLFENLIAGTYTIVVTDVNNCTATIMVTITEPGVPLTIDQINATNIDCYGEINGEAEVLVSGGIAPYQFDIGNGIQTSNLFTGLSEGSYTVTVTDANGEIVNDNFFISQPIWPLTVGFVTEDVECFGENTGILHLSVIFGTPPYLHSIGNGNQNSSTFEDLSAGNYSFTVTDANGCTVSDIATISQPDTLIVQTQDIVDVSCFAGGDGSINFDKSGGVGGATYDIGFGNQNSSFFNGLTAGNYMVTITDGNGCMDTALAAVGSPQELISMIVSTNNATTQGGGMDGNVTVVANGGTGPYQYSLNGTTNFSGVFDNLTAGTYAITITDANNCQTTATATITEITLNCPPMADFSYVIDGLDVVFTNNSIDATDYNWVFGDSNISNDENPMHSYAQAGTYTISLTATSTDCSGDADIFTETITVYDPADIVFEIANYHGFPDSIMEVEVIVQNFENVTGFQFSIQMDTNLVEILTENGNYVYDGALGNDATISSSANGGGAIGILWYTFTAPTTVPNDGVLLKFKVKLKDVGNACAPFAFTNSPTAMEVITDGINLGNFINIDGQVCVLESLIIAGKMTTPSGISMNLADVLVTGTQTRNMTTGLDGQYNFTDVMTGGNYEVCGSKSGNLTNGVNGIDIQAIQQHILGQNPFTELWQYIAGDVIHLGSTQISIADIYQIQQAVLGNINEFPVGGSYLILPDSVYYNSAIGVTSFDTCFHYTNLQADTLNQDFIGIKYGDVDNDADPTQFVSAENVIVGISDAGVEKGDTVVIPIYGYAIDDLMGWQWTNTWDSEVLDFVEALDFNDGLMLGLSQANFGSNVDDLAMGNLSFLWTSFNFIPIAIEDSTELFKLKFIAIGEEGSYSPFNITSNVTDIFAFNSSSEEIMIEDTDGVVQINLINSTNDLDVKNQLKIYPNPAKQQFFIEFESTKLGPATISIFDVTSKNIQQEMSIQLNGNQNRFAIDSQGFPKGVYWIKITVEEAFFFERIVIQ